MMIHDVDLRPEVEFLAVKQLGSHFGFNFLASNWVDEKCPALRRRASTSRRREETMSRTWPGNEYIRNGALLSVGDMICTANL